MSQLIGSVVSSTGGSTGLPDATIAFQTNNVSATGTAIDCDVGTFTINTATPATQSFITGERTFYAHTSLRTTMTPVANTNQTGAATQAIALGAGDFCIETWINPVAWDATNSSMTIWASITSNTDQQGLLLDFDQTGTVLEMWQGGASALTKLAGVTVTYGFLGQWTHMAVARSSGVITVYVNGTSAFSFANVTNFSTAKSFNFGNTVYTVSGAAQHRTFTACFGPTRITVGSARYTGNFEVNPLPYGYSIGSAAIADSNIPYLTAGLRDDGNVIYDVKGQILIQYGVPTVASSPPSGPGTLSYNFTGAAFSYVLMNAALSSSTLANPTPAGGPMTAFNFGVGSTRSTTDFTIDMWVNPGTQTGANPRVAGSSSQQANTTATGVWNLCYANTIAGGGGAGNTFFTLFIGSNSTTAAVLTSAACPAGSWYHVRIVRHLTTYYLFVNGVLQATSPSITTTFATAPGSGLVIGGSIVAASAFVGQICGFTTWSKALSTTTFTPSTTQIQDLLLIGGQ